MPRIHIPADVDRRVREAADNCCGYCLSPRHLVYGRLQIEHIIPLAKGGSNAEANLWLSCSLCNNHKSDKINAVDPETGESAALFNPRTQKWLDHFCWSHDGIRVIGLTSTGRATVVALHLSDDPDALEVRSYWVLAGWHPPQT